MLGQKVLMLLLRRVETVVGFQFGHNGLVERTGGVELGDVGLGDALLFGVCGKIADRYWVPLSGPWRFSSVGLCATEK